MNPKIIKVLVTEMRLGAADDDDNPIRLTTDYWILKDDTTQLLFSDDPWHPEPRCEVCNNKYGKLPCKLGSFYFCSDICFRDWVLEKAKETGFAVTRVKEQP